MDDVGDDEVRLLDHPPVPVGDREALRRGLDALREEGIRNSWRYLILFSLPKSRTRKVYKKMNELEKQFFVELTNDRTESANVLEKPSLSGVQHSVVEKYSDQAHFIYELLQNADDARATDARFYLYRDKLVFIHNGTRHFNITDPANEKEDADNGTLGDLNAITSVANSAKSGNKATIGKFGVGFKAVFQYTETPHIYDPNVSFKIVRFIVPQPIEGDYPGRKKDETVFVFPFDHKERNAQEAFEDISDKLRHLVYPNLFLNHLKDISFEIENKKLIGMYEKTCLKEKKFGDVIARKLEMQYNEGNEIVSDILWLFSRKDEHDRDYCVGFFIGTDGKLKPVSMSAFCYFPTKEETKLQFIIHAPFLLTDSREGIKAGEVHNKNMIMLLSKLSAEALLHLRTIGEEEGVRLIDDDILDIVPFDKDSFAALDDKAKISFLPFYNELKDALKNGLLPTKDGYTSYDCARWSQTKDISSLFSDEQISQLFDEDELHWVFCSRPRHALDAYGKTVIKNYIDNLVSSWYNEDDIMDAIDAGFVEHQSFDWLHKLYKWLSDVPRRFKDWNCKPIFLNVQGRPAAAYDRNGQKTLFLPSMAVKDCPTIHPDFLQNADTKKFLLDVVKLEEPSLQDYIYNTVIPNYKHDTDSDPFEYFKLFFSYYKECRATEIDDYVEKISDLDFLEYYDSKEETYKRCVACNLYYPEKELIEYFSAKPDTRFVAIDKYFKEFSKDDQLNLFLNKLGVMHHPKVYTHELSLDERRTAPDLPEKYSTSGHRYFETRVDGCIELASYIEDNMVAEKSYLLWHVIVDLIEQQNGITDPGTYRYHYYTQHHEHYTSLMAKLLQSKKWLVDKDGNFVCSHEVKVSDLSTEYGTESEAAQKLIEYLEFSEEEMELVGGTVVRNKSIEDYDVEIFSPPQLNQIRIGIDHGVDVSFYDNADMTFRQMREIRIGLEQKLDVSFYANKYYRDKQMREIRLGLMERLDVLAYARLVYSLTDMQNKRAEQFKEKYSKDPSSLDFDLYDPEIGLQIRTEDGMMRAVIQLTKPLPEDFGETALRSLLNAYGISAGLCIDKLDLEHLETDTEYEVAVGKHPCDGVDGYYEYFTELMDEPPRIKEDGSIDYRAQREYVSAKPGNVVAVYHPAKFGENGDIIFGLGFLRLGCCRYGKVTDKIGVLFRKNSLNTTKWNINGADCVAEPRLKAHTVFIEFKVACRERRDAKHNRIVRIDVLARNHAGVIDGNGNVRGVTLVFAPIQKCTHGVRSEGFFRERTEIDITHRKLHRLQGVPISDA